MNLKITYKDQTEEDFSITEHAQLTELLNRDPEFLVFTKYGARVTVAIPKDDISKIELGP